MGDRQTDRRRRQRVISKYQTDRQTDREKTETQTDRYIETYRKRKRHSDSSSQ